jgi:hypothetical protein
MVQGSVFANQLDLGLSIRDGGSVEGKVRYRVTPNWDIQISGPVDDDRYLFSGVYRLKPDTKNLFNSYIGAGYLMGGDDLSESLQLVGGVDFTLFSSGITTSLEARSSFGGKTYVGLSFMVTLGQEVPEEEIELLATIIAAEAGNQPFEGKVAVGAVVLNRVKSPLFPNTVRHVIYQPNQFTPVSDGRIKRVRPDESCYAAARAAWAGKDPSNGALYFYNPDKASRDGLRFMASRKVTARIGDHVFCK